MILPATPIPLLAPGLGPSELQIGGHWLGGPRVQGFAQLTFIKCFCISAPFCLAMGGGVGLVCLLHYSAIKQCEEGKKKCNLFRSQFPSSVPLLSSPTRTSWTHLHTWVKITARECGRDGGGGAFLAALFGTLALWPDRAGILIGMGLTGAQTKHRDFSGHGQGLSACHSITGAKKTNPISK